MLLDADVLIDLLRGVPDARSWLNALETPPAVSGIAALEVLYGARDKSELRAVRAYLPPFAVLWPIEDDARAASRLAEYHLSDGTDLLDVLTAAIAIRHGMTLVTFNIRHFRAIPGLTTIQPYGTR